MAFSIRRLFRGVKYPKALSLWFKKIGSQNNSRVFLSSLVRELLVNIKVRKPIFKVLNEISVLIDSFPGCQDKGLGLLFDVISRNPSLYQNNSISASMKLPGFGLSHIRELSSVKFHLCNGKGATFGSQDHFLIDSIKKGEFVPRGTLRGRLPVCWATKTSSVDSLRGMSPPHNLPDIIRNCLGLLYDSGDILVEIIYPDFSGYGGIRFFHPTLIHACGYLPFSGCNPTSGFGRAIHLEYAIRCAPETVHDTIDTKSLARPLGARWVGEVISPLDVDWRGIIVQNKWGPKSC